mmetsp:Transcript_18218/g.50324  ORF Transcript_18218/g.50324 Transcript_18218/m.50324 type:complete len:235 (+) Transcript_18218:513-1217(+)
MERCRPAASRYHSPLPLGSSTARSLSTGGVPGKQGCSPRQKRLNSRMTSAMSMPKVRKTIRKSRASSCSHRTSFRKEGTMKCLPAPAASGTPGSTTPSGNRSCFLSSSYTPRTPSPGCPALTNVFFNTCSSAFGMRKTSSSSSAYVTRPSCACGVGPVTNRHDAAAARFPSSSRLSGLVFSHVPQQASLSKALTIWSQSTFFTGSHMMMVLLMSKCSTRGLRASMSTCTGVVGV